MKTNRVLSILFFGLASIFLISIIFYPYPFSFILKAAPILFLLVCVFIYVPGEKGKLLSVGYLLSAVGDILLDIDPERFFIFAMSSFVVAHLCYILVFIPQPKLKGMRILFVSIIVAYAIVMGIILLNRSDELNYYVLGYIGVIALMGISAVVGSENHNWVILGAVLFMISDTLIAVKRFIVPIPLANVWIMAFYYAAQYFIAFGSVKGAEDQSSDA